MQRRIRDDGVGLDEAGEQRVIPAGVVKVQAQRGLVILAGEAPGRNSTRCRGTAG